MKATHSVQFLFAATAALCLSACSGVKITHVKPGTSARRALAEKNAPPTAPVDLPVPAAPAGPAVAGSPLPPMPAQDALPALHSAKAGLPSSSNVAETVADAYTRGSFAMQAGQNAEAVTAFEEAVKIDPEFTDAWGKLAILYSKNGQNAKATDAFKKAKRLGDANGGTTTRDAVSGLPLLQ